MAAGANQPTSQLLRVLIVDDDALVRRAMRGTLDQAEGFTVVAAAGSAQEGVELAIRYRPDVILMDVAMPEEDGLSAMARILERLPEAKIVIFSASSENEVALSALRAGATGFLPKSTDAESFPRALRLAAEGEPVVPRSLTRDLVESLRKPAEAGPGMRPVKSELTQREWEVLDLLSRGATPDEIADELVLTVDTVHSHTKHIYRKLGVSSRAEAIAQAQQLRDSVG